MEGSSAFWNNKPFTFDEEFEAHVNHGDHEE